MSAVQASWHIWRNRRWRTNYCWAVCRWLWRAADSRLSMAVPGNCWSVFTSTVAQVMTHEGGLKERIAQALVPEAVGKSIGDRHRRNHPSSRPSEVRLASFDPTLAAAAGKSRAKILYQLEKIGKKKPRANAAPRWTRFGRRVTCCNDLSAPVSAGTVLFDPSLPGATRLDPIDRLSDAVEPMCLDHRVYTITGVFRIIAMRITMLIGRVVLPAICVSLFLNAQTADRPRFSDFTVPSVYHGKRANPQVDHRKQDYPGYRAVSSDVDKPPNLRVSM